MPLLQLPLYSSIIIATFDANLFIVKLHKLWHTVCAITIWDHYQQLLTSISSQAGRCDSIKDPIFYSVISINIIFDFHLLYYSYTTISSIVGDGNMYSECDPNLLPFSVMAIPSFSTQSSRNSQHSKSGEARDSTISPVEFGDQSQRTTCTKCRKEVQ